MSSASKSEDFPKDLSFGFGTSSYQVEGAWNIDGKGENVWDSFVHAQPDKIADRSTADIACDSYHKFKEDIAAMKNMGAQMYKFSLSWTRILPTGFKYKINKKGIEYYNNLIDELLKNEIEPVVTLYHWDLPKTLQDLDGWSNPILGNYFYDLAEVAFLYFGDRVKKWITFNEPYEICHLSNGLGEYPPGKSMTGIADYMAGLTILKTHAKVYHLYDQKYRPRQRGEIGISISTNWIEPKTDAPADIAAAQDFMQFSVGWFAHPIFSKEKDYPEVFKNKIAERSREEGFPISRLPELDTYWVTYVNGTADFYGLNHYTTYLASYDEKYGQKDDTSSYANDHGVILSSDPKWPKGIDWLNVVPWGLRKALNWVKNEYNNPKIYITANGYGCHDSNLKDGNRISYYHAYLTEMLKGIKEDGCQIKMYTAWSLLDNFEWNMGYTAKFGIIHVDFNDESRKRTPKSSSEYFKYILKHRKLPENLKHFI